MTEKRKQHIHLLYGITLSVMLAVSAILLMLACVGICRLGEQPFSPESVAAAFSPIAIPVLCTAALVILGFLLDLFLPKADEKPSVLTQYSMTLKRMHKKADLGQADADVLRSISAQQRSRKLHKLISAGLLVIGSIVFLCFALQKDAFHPSEINDSVIRAMAVLLPCMFIPFGYAVFAAFHARASMKKEIALLKQLPSRPATPNEEASQRERNTIAIARSLLLCIGAAALIYGLLSGGTADVLTKAINICTECVGLG